MPPSSFKEWLRYWVIFFSWDEGNLSSWLPTYIGTLWAIWKLRNAQVFRHQRPTIPSITFHLQDSVKLHDTFTQACHDPTRNPRDPTIPPGFDVVHLGQQTHGTPSLTIQIAGRKYKLRSLGGVAWVGDMGDHNGHLQHSSICYTTSHILAEATACFHAIAWATTHHHMQPRIMTESRAFIHHLRSTQSLDIRIRWTIDRIAHLARQCITCQVVQVPRSQVREAYQLACWWRQHCRAPT